MDERIAKLKRKKVLLEEYKKGMMQKLFSQEIRFKDEDGNEFPDWSEVMLGDVLSYEQPTQYIVSSTDYNDNNPTPVLTAGKTFVLGYTHEDFDVYRDVPVIIFDDFTTASKYVDFAFKVKSSAMKILSPSGPESSLRFLFEALCMVRHRVGDEHKRFWISEFSKKVIPYPCQKEQEAIANALGVLDENVLVVRSQIEKAQDFKRGLLQKMFV